MNLVIEHVDSGLERLDRKIDDATNTLRRDIADIRDAGGQNSRDIRQNTEHIRTQSGEIRNLRDEVGRLRHDFEHRPERGRVGR